MTEFGGTRDFLATLAAIDSIFLADRAPNSINLVSTEKLTRKALAFYKAAAEV